MVITGASSGLGLAAAKALGQDGDWHVIMACRDFSKAARAAQSQGIPKENYTIMHLDLAAFDSVRQFVEVSRRRAAVQGHLCVLGRPRVYALRRLCNINGLPGRLQDSSAALPAWRALKVLCRIAHAPDTARDLQLGMCSHRGPVRRLSVLDLGHSRFSPRSGQISSGALLTAELPQQRQAAGRAGLQCCSVPPHRQGAAVHGRWL